MQRHIGKDRKAWYFKKLRFIGGADPYELAPSSWIRDDPVILPSCAYPDIVNYLVFSPSPHTAEDLKSYKGLEVYNQMVCGWVRETQYQVMNDCCVVKAKVNNAITSLINLTYSKCFSRSVLLVQPDTNLIGTTAIINNFPWRRSGYNSAPVLCCDASDDASWKPSIFNIWNFETLSASLHCDVFQNVVTIEIEWNIPLKKERIVQHFSSAHHIFTSTS